MTSIYDDSNMQSVPTIPAELEEGELDETGENATQGSDHPQTPPASPHSEPECPGAPARPQRPPALLMPQLSDHRGRGILAGDYIKPDPVLTRQETRHYVVAELERWLTGRICVHAKEVAVVFDEDPAAVALLVAAGQWPAARLWLVLKGLEGVAEQVGLPADYEERFHWVGAWSARACADHLSGYSLDGSPADWRRQQPYEAVAPAAQMAVGFVTTDLLPGGRTIDSFWSHSPFEALRAAPPLPDSDTEEDAEAEAEAEADTWAEAIGPVGIESFLDHVTLDVWKALQLRVQVPLWLPLASLGAFTAYIWLVVLVFVSR
jgi:hypothetical protein